MVRMEYKIISGRTIETRQCWMPARSSAPFKKKRAPRVCGHTSLKKIAANEREAIRRLARIINCNFGCGDLWITLKYSDDRLPASYEEAKKEITKFLRKIRTAYRADTGKNLRYIITTSQENPRTGEKARLHHHIVMDRIAYEFLCRHWPQDEISYTIMDNRGDHTAMARYMIQNAPKEADKKKWSTSQGLKKPIYTEPEAIASIGKIEPLVGAEIKENMLIQDADSGIETAYMRCVVDIPPEVRGNTVIFPKKRRRKGLSDPTNVRVRTRKQ